MREFSPIISFSCLLLLFGYGLLLILKFCCHHFHLIIMDSWHLKQQVNLFLLHDYQNLHLINFFESYEYLLQRLFKFNLNFSQKNLFNLAAKEYYKLLSYLNNFTPKRQTTFQLIHSSTLLKQSQQQLTHFLKLCYFRLTNS